MASNEHDWKYILTTSITLVLFLWSEYLGLSNKHKSNAIIQLLMCALTPKEDSDNPPAVISLPLASSSHPSS